MAGVKVTDLDSATGVPAVDDILIIVDRDTNITKQIKAGDLLLGQTANQSNQVLLTTSTEANNKVLFGNGANGEYDSVNISDNLTYNASTGELAATRFAGSGADLTDLPTNAPVVNAVDAGADDDGYHLMIRKTTTGEDSVQTASNLLFNPNTGVFSAPFVAGDGSQLTGVKADSALVAASALSANFAVNATNADSALVAATALLAVRATIADSAALAALSVRADLATYALAADSAIASSTTLLADRSTNVIAVAATSETAVYPILVDGLTGKQLPLTDGPLVYNPQTETLSVTKITGDGSGLTNLPLTASGVVATAVNVTPTAVDASHSIIFTQSPTGVDSVNTDPDFTYNPSTNLLSVVNLGGNGALLTEVPAVSITSKTGPSTGTQYVLMKANQTGDDSVTTDAGAVWDAATDTMSFTNVAGNGAGLTNVAALSATNATNIAVSSVDSNATYYIHFGSGASGNDNVNVDLDLTYNPSTNVLGADNLFVSDSAGLWTGTAPVTTNDAINRLAYRVKVLNGGTPA